MTAAKLTDKSTKAVEPAGSWLLLALRTLSITVTASHNGRRREREKRVSMLGF